jgi:hypothetical protein
MAMQMQVSDARFQAESGWNCKAVIKNLYET